MRLFFRDVVLLLLNALVLISAAGEELIFTNHALVQLHEGTDEDAHTLALENGFGSARKVRAPERLQTCHVDACMLK